MKKMQLRILSLLLVACGHATLGNASGKHFETLVFDFYDGTQTEFMLSEKPSVIFEEGKVSVEAGTTITSYDMARVSGYHFSDIPTVIKGSEKKTLSLHFTDNANITIDGTTAKSASLYDMSGKLLTTQGVKGGSITLSVADAAKGVYIVKLSDGQSFKLLKK